ncbi:MAG: L-lactate dehydrogenase [Geitlerinemataceae cyanobacterium]
MTPSSSRKVAVVGAGAVGSTFAFALAQAGLADEIVLIDNNADLAQGQVLDMAHGEPFFPTVSIRAGNATEYADARLVVVTAGSAQRPGETRLDLLSRNAAIVRSIVSEIVARSPDAIVLIVTNPVDVMTQVAIDCAGLAPGRVFGSGTVLDSARFRYFLSECCDIDVHNVHGYILGEHGDSEFAAWSMTNVAGIAIERFVREHSQVSDWAAEKQQIEQKVRDSAYHIIGYKGATWFAVGLALVEIARAVLRGEKRVMTVSTLLRGELGLDGVCLSVPCIVSENGVEQAIDCQLDAAELAALQSSADVLKAAIAQLRSE